MALLPRDTPPNIGPYRAPHVLWAPHVLTNYTRPDLRSDGHRRWLLAYWQRAGRLLGIPAPRLDDPLATDVTTTAFVQRNTWLARCAWCAGAEGVWGEGDWFWCCSCGNEPVQGRRIAVVFTQPPGLVQALLDQRTEAHQRNWRPDETAQELARQNAQLLLPEDAPEEEPPAEDELLALPEPAAIPAGELHPGTVENATAGLASSRRRAPRRVA